MCTIAQYTNQKFYGAVDSGTCHVASWLGLARALALWILRSGMAHLSQPGQAAACSFFNWKWRKRSSNLGGTICSLWNESQSALSYLAKTHAHTRFEARHWCRHPGPRSSPWQGYKFILSWFHFVVPKIVTLYRVQINHPLQCMISFFYVY
jgi:hypothetical protein